MLSLIGQIATQIIRWAIYLALMGEITHCTLDLRKKAGQSVQTGLINLKNLNDSLHQRR